MLACAVRVELRLVQLHLPHRLAASLTANPMWKGSPIGSTGCNNAVDVIRFRDRTDRDRCNARFVAHAIGERRLKHASVHRILALAYLSRRAVDHVRAGILERSADQWQ